MEIYFNRETKGYLIKNGENILSLSADEFEDIRGGVLPFILYKMKKESEAGRFKKQEAAE